MGMSGTLRDDPPPAQPQSSLPAAAPVLSTAPAGPVERRVALGVVVASVLVFTGLAPLATTPLTPVWSFIPIYQTALIFGDLMTALLLLGQARIARSPGLQVLSCGYFFTAFIAAMHMLTFPGLFAPTGLLGATPQSTAWIYMFWHTGFPVFVLAYALPARGADSAPPAAAGRPPGAGVVVFAFVAAALCVMLATAGAPMLPAIMVGNHYSPAMRVVVGSVWMASLAAIVVLWRRKPHSILDLWLLVVMCAWVFDIALSAVLNAGRFDLGFYAGRIYGLLAASFVLVMLAAENGTLYARLARAHEREQHKAADARELSLQLEAVNLTLGEQNRQLEEASRLKSQFLSNMSHELRTPLNAVIGFSEVMKDGLAGELTPQQGGYVGHIFESGQHLLSLINDVLDLSKIEADKVEIEFSAVDLDAMLADSVALLSDKAASTQVRLRLEATHTLGSFMADKRRLRQIVLNLLSNAIKFTPAHGQVSLHARLVDRATADSALPGFGLGVRMTLPDNAFQRFVELSVVDTGIGITPEDARRLFMPFTQIANQLTKRIEGTGLGLAMVKRLAELHGGTVAVTSETGRGSCFTVWLPWREAEAPVAVDTVPAPAAARATANPTPLALIIEDDDEAAALMMLQLRTEGFEVRAVTSAEAALALTGSITPDVITVDILLPGMDGWEFIERLRDVPAWADIPVVVVSVMADHRRGFSLGASLVLQKPVGRHVLSRGLARIGLKPGGDSTVLVVDDDANAVEIMATHLRQSGYTVLRATGGAEGIELARRYRPDLIALDLEMPEVSGFDVVEALSGHPGTSGIPIVIVTARQVTPATRKRLNGHIHDIVDKVGFDRGRFMGEVRRAISRQAEGA
ncbi:response regulator [Piscinibacter terrae]|nr:response regulator [Albitalea terrae]